MILLVIALAAICFTLGLYIAISTVKDGEFSIINVLVSALFFFFSFWGLVIAIKIVVKI